MVNKNNTSLASYVVVFRIIVLIKTKIGIYEKRLEFFNLTQF